MINGYGQCIVDNLNKYPNAVPCSKSNNKYQLVETVCSSNKDYSNHSTCLKQVAYNTDCYSGNPPSAPKPGVPDGEDDGDGPINSISCRIPTFSFYDKLAKPPKYVSNLFTTQKIVENPTLEYYAQDCDTCKLVITSEDGHDVKEFILNNSLFDGMLEPTGATDEENERYIFEASYIKLDTRGLKPGDYIISIHCTDPIFGGPVIGMRKFTTGEEYPP
ncbi:MAG: hypothetical protein WC422_02260 [Candidatus Paceibacterota bacterium]